MFETSSGGARPKDNGHYTCLAAMLKDQGRTEEVNTLIEGAHRREERAAIDLEPGRWQGHLDYGKVLQIQGKLAEATAEFREALRINPRFAGFQRHPRRNSDHSGKFDDAVAVRRQAVRVEPDNADAHNNLGCRI